MKLAVEQLATGMTQISNTVNGHAQKINEMSTQFSEAIGLLARLTPMLQQTASDQGGGNGKDVLIPNADAATQPNPPVPASPNALVNVPSIMDKLLQVYMLSKQQASDPMAQLMSSMDLGMGLITKMSQFMSALKGDWIKDQKIALDTIKTDSKVSKKAPAPQKEE